MPDSAAARRMTACKRALARLCTLGTFLFGHWLEICVPHRYSNAPMDGCCCAVSLFLSASSAQPRMVVGARVAVCPGPRCVSRAMRRISFRDPMQTRRGTEWRALQKIPAEDSTVRKQPLVHSLFVCSFRSQQTFVLLITLAALLLFPQPTLPQQLQHNRLPGVEGWGCCSELLRSVPRDRATSQPTSNGGKDTSQEGVRKAGRRKRAICSKIVDWSNLQ